MLYWIWANSYGSTRLKQSNTWERNTCRQNYRKLNRRCRITLLTLDSINDGHLDYFSVDPFGNRLHTPLTGLYSRARKFMYFENCPDEPLVHMSIKNSQVYLVSCIIAHPSVIDIILPEFTSCRSQLEEFMNAEDVIAFYNDCCEGKIYESLARTISGPQSNPNQNDNSFLETMRKRAKKQLISYLYSKLKLADDKTNSNSKMFLELTYPNVDKAIKCIKSMGEKDFPFMREFYTDSRTGKYVGDNATHKNLSRMMQLMESRIILGMVSSSLLQNGCTSFITIHDAFIVPLS